LLERPLGWYLVLFAALLTVLRKTVGDTNFVHEPQIYLKQVASHTHYVPKLWRQEPASHKVACRFLFAFDQKSNGRIVQSIS